MSDFRYTFGEKKGKDGKGTDGVGVIQIKKTNRVPNGIVDIGTPLQFTYNDNNVNFGLNKSKGIKISLGDGAFVPDKTSADITLSTDTVVLKKFEVKDNVKIDSNNIIFKNKDETINYVFSDTNKREYDYYRLFNTNDTFNVYDNNLLYKKTEYWYNTLEIPKKMYDLNLGILSGDLSYNIYGDISYNNQIKTDKEYFYASDENQNKITFRVNKYNTVSFKIPTEHLIFSSEDNKYTLNRWNQLSNFIFETYDDIDTSSNITLRTWSEINHYVNAFMFTKPNTIKTELSKIGFKDRSINLYRHAFSIDSFVLDKITTTINDLKFYNEAYNEKDVLLSDNQNLNALSWIKVAYPINSGNIFYIQNVDVYKINPYITLNVIGLKVVRIGKIYFVNNYEYTYDIKTADIYSNLEIDSLSRFNNVTEIQNTYDTHDYVLNETLTLKTNQRIFDNELNNTNYSRINNIDTSLVIHDNVSKFSFTNLEDDGETTNTSLSTTYFYGKTDAEYYSKLQYISDQSGLFLNYNSNNNLDYINTLITTSVKSRIYDVSYNLFNDIFFNNYKIEAFLPNNPILINKKSDINDFSNRFRTSFIKVKLFTDKLLNKSNIVLESSELIDNLFKFYYDDYCGEKKITDLEDNYQFKYHGMFGISGSYDSNDVSGWIKNTEGSKISWNKIMHGPEYSSSDYDISFIRPGDINLNYLTENTGLSGESIGIISKKNMDNSFYFLNEKENPELFTNNIIFHNKNIIRIKKALEDLKQTEQVTRLYNENGIKLTTIKDRISLLSTNGDILWSDIYDTNINKFYENKYENNINKPNLDKELDYLLDNNSWGKLHYYFDGENIFYSESGVYFQNNTKDYNFNNWIVLKKINQNSSDYYYFRNILTRKLDFFNKDIYEKGRLELKGVDIYEKIEGSRNDPNRATAESLNDLIVNNHLPNKFMYHNMLEKPLPLDINATAQTDKIIIKWINHKQYGTSVPLNNDGNNHVKGYLYLPIINDIYLEYMPVSRNPNKNELSQPGWWDNIGSYSIDINKKEIPKKILIGGKNLINNNNKFINIVLFNNIDQITDSWISENLEKEFDICGQDGTSSINYVGQKIKLSDLGSSSLINPTMLDFRGFYDKSLFILGDVITGDQLSNYDISKNKSWETSRKAFDGSNNTSETYSENFVILSGHQVTDVDGRYFTFKVNNRWYRNLKTDTARKIIKRDSNQDGIINMHTVLRFYYLSTNNTIDIQNKSNTSQILSQDMTNTIILYTDSATSKDYEINSDKSISENNEVIFNVKGEIEINKNKQMTDVFHPNDPNIKLVSAISSNNRLDSFGNLIGDYSPIEEQKLYAIRVYIDNNDPESEQNYSNILVLSTSIVGIPTPPGQLYGNLQFEAPKLNLIKDNLNLFDDNLNNPLLNTKFKTPADNDNQNIIIDGEIKSGTNPSSDVIPESNKSSVPFIDYYFLKFYESFNFSNYWTPPKKGFPFRQNEGKSIFNNITEFYDKKLLMGTNITKPEDLQLFSRLNGNTVFSARKIFPFIVNNISSDDKNFKHLLYDNYQFKIHSSKSETSQYLVKSWNDISLSTLTSEVGNNYIRITPPLNNDYQYIRNYTRCETRYTISDDLYSDLDIGTPTNLELKVFDYKKDAVYYAYTGNIRANTETSDSRYYDYHWFVLNDSDSNNYFYFQNLSYKNIALSSGENKNIDNYIVNNIDDILVFQNRIHIDEYLKQPLSIPDITRIDEFKVKSFDNEITFYPMFNTAWNPNNQEITTINSELDLLNIDSGPYITDDILHFNLRLESNQNRLNENIFLTEIDSEIMDSDNLVMTDSNGDNKTSGPIDTSYLLKIKNNGSIRYAKNNLFFDENYWLGIKYNVENYIFNSLSEANGTEFIVTNNVITFKTGISQNCTVVGTLGNDPFIIGNASNDFSLSTNWSRDDDILLTLNSDTAVTITIDNKYRHYFLNKGDFLNHEGVTQPNQYINEILNKINGLNVLSYEIVPPNASASQNIQDNNFNSLPLFTKNLKDTVIFDVFENREKAAKFVNTKGSNIGDILTAEQTFNFRYWVVIRVNTDSKITFYYFQNTPTNKFGKVQNKDIARVGTLSNFPGSIVEQNNGQLITEINKSFDIYRNKVFNNENDNYSLKYNVQAKNMSNINESEFKGNLTSNLSNDTTSFDILPPSKPLGWTGRNDLSNNIFTDLDDITSNWDNYYKYIGIQKTTLLDSTTVDYEIPIYKKYTELVNKEHLYQDVTFYKSVSIIPDLQNTNGNYFSDDTNGKIYVFDTSNEAKVFAEQSQQRIDNTDLYIYKNINISQSIDGSGNNQDFNINHWLVYEKNNTSDGENDYYYLQNKTLLSCNATTTSRVFNISWDTNGSKNIITSTKIYDSSNNIYDNTLLSNIFRIENAHDYIYIKNISKPYNRFVNDTTIDISWSAPEYSSDHHNINKRLIENNLGIQYYRLYRNQTSWNTYKINTSSNWKRGIDISMNDGWEDGELYEYYYADTELTWNQHRIIASTMGSYIVSINSHFENEFISSLSPDNELWIGYYYDTSVNMAIWTDNNKLPSDDNYINIWDKPYKIDNNDPNNANKYLKLNNDSLWEYSSDISLRTVYKRKIPIDNILLTNDTKNNDYIYTNSLFSIDTIRTAYENFYDEWDEKKYFIKQLYGPPFDNSFNSPNILTENIRDITKQGELLYFSFSQELQYNLKKYQNSTKIIDLYQNNSKLTIYRYDYWCKVENISFYKWGGNNPSVSTDNIITDEHWLKVKIINDAGEYYTKNIDPQYLLNYNIQYVKYNNGVLNTTSRTLDKHSVVRFTRKGSQPSNGPKFIYNYFINNDNVIKNSNKYQYNILHYNGKRSLNVTEGQVVNIDTASDMDDHNLTLVYKRPFLFDITCENYILSKTSIYSNPSYYLQANTPDKPINIFAKVMHENSTRSSNHLKVSWEPPVNTGELYNGTHPSNGIKKGNTLSIKRYILEYSNNNSFTENNSWLCVEGTSSDSRTDHADEFSRHQSIGDISFITLDSSLNDNSFNLSANILINLDKTNSNEPSTYQFKVKAKNHFISENSENTYSDDWYNIGYSDYLISDQSLITFSVPGNMHFGKTQIINNGGTGIKISYSDNDSVNIASDMNFYKNPDKYQKYNTVPFRGFKVKSWASDFNHNNENKFNAVGNWVTSEHGTSLNNLYESNRQDWLDNDLKQTHIINEQSDYSSIPSNIYFNRLFNEYVYSYKIYARNEFNKYFNNNEDDEINGVKPNFFITTYIGNPKIKVDATPTITMSPANNTAVINLKEPGYWKLKDTCGNNTTYGNKIFSNTNELFDLGIWHFNKYNLVRHYHNFDEEPNINNMTFTSPDNEQFVTTSGEHFHNIPHLDMSFNIYLYDTNGVYISDVFIRNDTTIQLDNNYIIEISGNHNQMYFKNNADLQIGSSRRRYLEQYDISLCRYNDINTVEDNTNVIPIVEYLKWWDISNEVLTIENGSGTYSEYTWLTYGGHYFQNSHTGHINNVFSGKIFSFMVQTGVASNKSSYLSNIYAYNIDNQFIKLGTFSDNTGEILIFNNFDDAKKYVYEIKTYQQSRISPLTGYGDLNINHGIVFNENIGNINSFYYLPNKNKGFSHFGFFRNRYVHINNSIATDNDTGIQLSYCKIWSECNDILCSSGNLQSDASKNQWKINLNGHKVDKYYINNDKNSQTHYWSNNSLLNMPFYTENDLKHLDNLDGVKLWKSSGLNNKPIGPIKFFTGTFNGSTPNFGFFKSHNTTNTPLVQPNRSFICFKNRIIAKKYADLKKDNNDKWKTLLSINFESNEDLWFVLRLDDDSSSTEEYYYFQNKIEDLYINGITTTTDINVSKYNDEPLDESPNSAIDNTGNSNKSVLFNTVASLDMMSILNDSKQIDIDSEKISWDNGNNPVSNIYSEQDSQQFQNFEDQDNSLNCLKVFSTRSKALTYSRENTLFKNLSQIYSTNDGQRTEIFTHIDKVISSWKIQVTGTYSSYSENTNKIINAQTLLPTSGDFDLYHNYTISFNVEHLQSYLALIPNKNSIQLNTQEYNNGFITDLSFGRWTACHYLFSNIEELEKGSPMRRALETGNGKIKTYSDTNCNTFVNEVTWDSLKDLVISYQSGDSNNSYNQNCIFEIGQTSQVYIKNRTGIMSYTDSCGTNFILDTIIEIEYYDRYNYYKIFFENHEYTYLKVFNNKYDAIYYANNWKTCNKGIWNGQKSIKDGGGLNNYNLSVNNWLVYNKGGDNVCYFQNRNGTDVYGDILTNNTSPNINEQTNWIVLEDTRDSSPSQPDKYTIFQNIRTDYKKEHWLFVTINNNYYRLRNIKNNQFVTSEDTSIPTIDVHGIELYCWNTAEECWDISGTFNSEENLEENLNNVKIISNHEITDITHSDYEGVDLFKEPTNITELQISDPGILSNSWILAEHGGKHYIFRNNKQYHLYSEYDNTRTINIDKDIGNDNTDWNGKEIGKLDIDKVYKISYKVRNGLNRYYSRISNPKYIQMTAPYTLTINTDTASTATGYSNTVTVNITKPTNMGFNNDWPNISTSNQPNHNNFTIELTVSGQIFNNRFDLQENWSKFNNLIVSSTGTKPNAIINSDNISITRDSNEIIDNFNLVYYKDDIIKIGNNYTFTNNRKNTYTKTQTNNVITFTSNPVDNANNVTILPNDNYYYKVYLTNKYWPSNESIKYFSTIKNMVNIPDKQDVEKHLNVTKIPDITLESDEKYTLASNTGDISLIENGGMRGHILLDTGKQEKDRTFSKRFKTNDQESYGLVYNISKRVDIWNINKSNVIHSGDTGDINLNINGEEYSDIYKSYSLPPNLAKEASDDNDDDFINNGQVISYNYIDQIGLGGSSQDDPSVGTLHMRLRFNRNTEHMHNAPLSFEINNAPDINSHFFNGDGNWIIGNWAHLGYNIDEADNTYNYDISNSYLTHGNGYEGNITTTNIGNLYSVTLNALDDERESYSDQRGSWFNGNFKYNIKLLENDNFRKLGFLGSRLDIVLDAYYGKGTNVKSLNPKLVGVDQFISKRISYQRNTSDTTLKNRALFFDDLNNNHTLSTGTDEFLDFKPGAGYISNNQWPQIYRMATPSVTYTKNTWSIDGNNVMSASTPFTKEISIKHYKVMGIPMLRPKRNDDIAGDVDSYYRKNTDNAFPNGTFQLPTNQGGYGWTPNSDLITHIKLSFLIDKSSDFFVPKTLANLYFRECYSSIPDPQSYFDDFVKYSRDMFSGDIILNSTDIKNTKGGLTNLTVTDEDPTHYYVGRHCSDGTTQIVNNSDSTHYYRCASYYKGLRNENFWYIQNLDIQSENILKINDWHGRQLHSNENVDESEQRGTSRNDIFFPKLISQYDDFDERKQHDATDTDTLNITSLLKTNIVVELQTHTIFNSYKFDPFKGYYFIYDHRTFDLLNYIDQQHIDKIEGTTKSFLTYNANHYVVKNDGDASKDYEISNIYYINVENGFHVDETAGHPGYFKEVFKGENMNSHYHRNDSELKSQLLLYQGLMCTPKYLFDELQSGDSNERLNNENMDEATIREKYFINSHIDTTVTSISSGYRYGIFKCLAKARQYTLGSGIIDVKTNLYITLVNTDITRDEIIDDTNQNIIIFIKYRREKGTSSVPENLESFWMRLSGQGTYDDIAAPITSSQILPEETSATSIINVRPSGWAMASVDDTSNKKLNTDKGHMVEIQSQLDLGDAKLTISKNGGTPIYQDDIQGNNGQRTDNSIEYPEYFNRVIFYVAIGIKNDVSKYIEGIDLEWR